MSAPEAPARAGCRLERRYTAADADVFTAAEASRFLHGATDPMDDPALAWELLYRLEPELYDRLARAERLHPAILDWLPESVGRVVEVGAGTGRLTLELARRASELIAVEPAAPLRAILARRLGDGDRRTAARVVDGFFDELPVADGWADLVVACSAFTPAPDHGGDAGLDEMERVCRPGGCVAIVWPNELDWLAARGYRHVSFEGEVCVEFASEREAAELLAIFYPDAPVRSPARRIPFERLGVNAPRDIAFKAMKQ